MKRKLWIALLLLLAGCGTSGTAIAPVSGRVTLDGKPLAQGVVCFVSPAGYASSAPLQPDGSFRLVSQYGKGIPPGDYRVAIAPASDLAAMDMTGKTPKTASEIPAKYQSVTTSGLSATVDGQHGVFTFSLSR